MQWVSATTTPTRPGTAIYGQATGFTISTGWSLMNGASWEDVLNQGWDGFKVGLVTDTATGIVSGYQRAKAEEVNPLTGKLKIEFTDKSINSFNDHAFSNNRHATCWP